MFYLVIASVNSKVTSWSALISEMVFALLGSVGLFISSTSYVKEKSFGRAPALLANLIALGVSYFMISGGTYVPGIPLAVVACSSIYFLIRGFKVS